MPHVAGNKVAGVASYAGVARGTEGRDGVMPTQMEHAASKVMGAVKQMKGAAQGLSGIFRTLMQEHGEVSTLLSRLEGSDDPELRRRLFPLIRKELLSHEKGELALLYPVFEQYEETAELAMQHDREAQTMESLIRRLHETAFESDRWGAIFEELVDAVQRHVREEESKLFPKGELAMGSRKAEALQYRYHATKQEIMAKL